MALLVLVSILLLCVDTVLAVVIARWCKPFELYRKLAEWMERERKSRTGRFAIHGGGDSDSQRMNPMERLELLYIDKSNIRHYIPFMNAYLLLAVSILLFFIAYRPIYGVLQFMPSAAVISGILSLIPFFALDLLARHNSETVRKSLSEYISVLNRWCSVKEDIMYAFEKSLGSDIGEPLQTFIRDMVIQVNRGMDPSEALSMLQMKVDNPQFADFVLNIKLSLRHRGDMIKLLSNLENQFYRIDEEYNRRRISTYRDRMLIYFVMFAVLAVAYFFISSTPQVGSFYLGTMQGKLLLMAFTGMYALGFYMTAGIMKFKH